MARSVAAKTAYLAVLSHHKRLQLRHVLHGAVAQLLALHEQCEQQRGGRAPRRQRVDELGNIVSQAEGHETSCRLAQGAAC